MVRKAESRLAAGLARLGQPGREVAVHVESPALGAHQVDDDEVLQTLRLGFVDGLAPAVALGEHVSRARPCLAVAGDEVRRSIRARLLEAGRLQRGAEGRQQAALDVAVAQIRDRLQGARGVGLHLVADRVERHAQVLENAGLGRKGGGGTEQSGGHQPGRPHRRRLQERAPRGMRIRHLPPPVARPRHRPSRFATRTLTQPRRTRFARGPHVRVRPPRAR